MERDKVAVNCADRADCNRATNVHSLDMNSVILVVDMHDTQNGLVRTEENCQTGASDSVNAMAVGTTPRGRRTGERVQEQRSSARVFVLAIGDENLIRFGDVRRADGGTGT